MPNMPHAARGKLNGLKIKKNKKSARRGGGAAAALGRELENRPGDDDRGQE
jgi:hypothetical protein